MGCDVCTKLLGEGLDLCVRARKLDSLDRRHVTLASSSNPEAWQKDGRFDTHVERHNIEFPHAPIEPRSLTLQIWTLDQYDKDLADWESRSRKHLMESCTP